MIHINFRDLWNIGFANEPSTDNAIWQIMRSGEKLKSSQYLSSLLQNV